MVGVLFVCMGNICRSPLAEGVFAHQASARGLFEAGLKCDSAGTSGYHVGQPPDARAVRVAASRGIDISGQRSRRVEPADFSRYQYIMAMDQYNVERLMESAPSGESHRIKLYLSYAPELGLSEVPDPYYGGGRGFETCFDLVHEAAGGLIEALVRDHFPDLRK
ncbi:MAG: low molecular weight protein-tyrosine-phosphatase [Sphingomonadales bacterium]